MKLTKYDKFAWLPKRCDNCNTLFIWEMYNTYYRSLGLQYDSPKLTKCRRCIVIKENKQ